MALDLRFDELEIVTASARKTTRFSRSISPIIGPVGTGKTSMLELLKYALGGDGQLSVTVQRHVEYVLLKGRFGVTSMTFGRRIGAKTLDVFDSDGVLVTTLACGRSRRYQQAASFLLEALEIPAQTVSSHRRTENLSFTDIYRYCYLPQSEIDRSVVRHDDKILARRRKATFEWMFGLSDAETAAAEEKVTQATNDLARARLEEGAVRKFLEAADEHSQGALEEELRSVGETADRAAFQLAKLRSDMREVTSSESSRQREIVELNAQARNLDAEIVALNARLRDYARAIAQHEARLEGLARSTSARRVLDSIEFARCPRCLQSIADRLLPAGACRVCTQPEPPRRTVSQFAQDDPEGQRSFDGEETNVERRRLQLLRDEVVWLATQDGETLSQLRDRRRTLQVAVRETLNALEYRTRNYVSPQFESISALSAEVARAEARRDAIRSALTYWERLRELSRSVTKLEGDLSRFKAEATAARKALEFRKEIVMDLSNEFDEQVRRLEPPWYQGASINLDTYLPNLNGASFKALSGGEKTMVNVAYHLALLTIALRHREVLLPSLLVIDTPRKNLGAGYDQTYAERIYRRIQTLTDAFGGKFQLIIADNDPPSVKLTDCEQIDLSYDDPLVPGVTHPGPEAESL